MNARFPSGRDGVRSFFMLPLFSWKDKIFFTSIRVHVNFSYSPAADSPWQQELQQQVRCTYIIKQPRAAADCNSRRGSFIHVLSLSGLLNCIWCLLKALLPDGSIPLK